MNSNTNISNKIKEALMLSSLLFIQGKQTLDQLIKSLEETGMDKKEAKQTAIEVLNMTDKYKKNFFKSFIKEVEKRSKKQGKKDIKDILEEISDKY